MKKFLKNLFSKKPSKKQWSKIVEYEENKDWEENQDGFYKEGTVMFNVGKFIRWIRRVK